ncbi:MAG: GAF domain-containing protein [Ramlibacter sp.]
MLSRLTAAKTLEETVQAGLRDVIALLGAEMGNVQLPGSDGRLVIVAARGLCLAFLKVFERVDIDSGSICGRAARQGKPVFVAEVATDADFKPYVEFARSVPFRSVLSFPLMSSAGELVGMVSAHSPNVLSPTSLELRTAEIYSRHFADLLVSLAPAIERLTYAEKRSAELLESAK